MSTGNRAAAATALVVIPVKPTMKNILRTASFWLLLLVATLANAQANHSFGEALYTSKCTVCHARDGSGETRIGQTIGTKSFGSPEVRENVSNWRDIIAKGKGKMPSYGRSLSDQQVSSLLLYIRSISQPTDKQQYAPLTDQPNTLAGNSQASWQPTFEFDNELYPSFVLSMGGRAFKTPDRARFFGDPLGMAAVQIRSLVPNALAHVEIQIEGLAQLSMLDVVLPEAGQQYRIAPLLQYDYSRLAKIDQSIPATVTYRVHVNDVDLGQRTVPIRVRSVNDVPYMAIGPGGKPLDLSFLFAAYVNESHPLVQDILQKALNWRAVNGFDGYQSDPEGVRLQVFALWNTLQRDQVHYSNITTPSALSPSRHVQSQAVRFIDQSFSSQQANCVDGSVLFASLLYKIGIQPVLVLKPGHMFVGYYLDAGHKNVEFLETTMLGTSKQPGRYNLRFSPILHPVQSSESWRQFVQATQYATQVFDQEVAPAIQQHRSQYRVIDIAKARQAGVNSIPR